MLVLLVAGLSACEDTGTLAPPPDKRNTVAAERLAEGAELFQRHCTSCHGVNAVGDPDWRKRGSDGRFPPPPLDGSAHTWHHPWAQLHNTIKNGGPRGKSNMPAWSTILTDEQIDTIILWFQSLWPADVYAVWYQMDTEARAATR